MELHLALRNIVKTDGPSIITEGRLVNILCDFQAFDAIPASKYVMRAIIDDGYSKKLLQCAKWDMAAQQLSGQFANSTGFQPDIVWTIFQSLAYGLGWVNSLEYSRKQSPAYPDANIPVHQKAPVVHITEKSNPRDKSLYLNSIVEKKENLETAIGISINNVSFNVSDDGKTITCNMEVTAQSISSTIDIKVVYYDKFGMIAKEDSGTIYKSSFKGFDIVQAYSFSFNTSIADISRVLVFPVQR